MKKNIKNLLLTLPIVTMLACGERMETDIPGHIRQLDKVKIYNSSDILNADTLLLTEKLVYAEPDSHMMGNLGNVVVDNYGRMYVGDSQQFSIHIFEENGNYAGNAGRKGDGPGEFRWIGRMFIRGSQLFVHDPNGKRVQVFDISPGSNHVLQFSYTISLNDTGMGHLAEEGFMNPLFRFITEEHQLILSLRNSPLGYRSDPAFEGVERFYKSGVGFANPPEFLLEITMPEHIVAEWFIIPPAFVPRDLVAFTSNGRIISANTNEFLITYHTTGGELLHAVYYPFNRKSLTREEALKTVEGYEQLPDAVRAMELPSSWPAIQSMFVDDENRLWAAAIAENTDIYEWWILEENGGPAARFGWPRNKPIAEAKNGFIYTIETDSETGLRQVARYKMSVRKR